jgi:Zn-dependent peptidase ImmA (M78 family)
MLAFAHRYLESAVALTAEGLVRGYADALLRASDAYGFPVDLALVAERFELPGPVTTAGIGQRGLTTPDLRIFLNAEDPATVRKFTLAHEFMEVFFVAFREGAADAWMSEAMFSEMNEESRKERLCDVGAAELIMPMEHFIEAMPAPVTLPWAEELASDGQVSLTATLWRLLETGLVEAVLVFWQYCLKPKETKAHDEGQLGLFDAVPEMQPLRKLRVQRVITPPKFEQYIPNQKSVPIESIITRAFLEKQYLCGRESIDLVGLEGEFWVEAQPFRLMDQDLAMSLIHFDS